MRIRSRQLIGALVVGVVLTLCTSPASARTLAPEPGGGGLVENPDHTWTLYGYGHVVKVLSAAEKETIDRVWRAEQFDLVGVESGEAVTGISHAEAEAAQGIVRRLRTGVPYTTGGERELGQGLVHADEEAGMFEKAGDALVGGLYLDLVGQGSPYAVSVPIGGGVERMITMPEWTAKRLGGEREYGEVDGHPTKHRWLWSPEFEVAAGPVSCASIAWATANPGEECAHAGAPVERVEEVWNPELGDTNSAVVPITSN